MQNKNLIVLDLQHFERTGGKIDYLARVGQSFYKRTFANSARFYAICMHCLNKIVEHGDVKIPFINSARSLCNTVFETLVF